jgi:hypothetical protein
LLQYCYSTATVNNPPLNNGSGSIYPMLREGESIPSATVLIFFIGRLRTGGMYQMLHYFSAVYCMILYLLSHPMQYRVFGSQLQRICNHNLCLEPDNCLAKCGSPICAVANCGHTKPLGRGQGKAVYSGKGGHPVPQQGTGAACFTPAKPTKIFLVL